MKYREQIYRESLQYSDLVDAGFDNNKEELIPKNVVSEIIDDIELEINDIIHNLESISGLTEIDEIKEKIYKLSEKLY